MKKIVLAFCLFLVLIFVFKKNIATGYAHLFEKNNATKGADMILMLSGNLYSRIEKSMELYQQGYAPMVMGTDEKEDLSEGLRRYSQSDEVIFDTILTVYKIPHGKITSLRPSGASSTFDEAYDVASYVKTHKIKHIVLVTDGFHSSRAYFAFKKIFLLQGISPAECKLEMAAAYTDGYNPQNWWRSEKGLLCYLTEPIKYLVYLFRVNNFKTMDDK